MIVIDAAMLIAFAGLTIWSLARLVGLLGGEVHERFASLVLHRAGIVAAMTLLTIFAALRVFEIGPGQIQTSIGLLGAALLLAVHAVFNRNTSNESTDTGGPDPNAG